MNNTVAIVLFLLSWALSVAAEPMKRPVNGVYTGWEPLPKMKGQGGADWFRLHRITIRDDALELWGEPVAIKNRELAYSASEGGFLFYKGEFYEKEGKLRVRFKKITETDEGEFIEDYGGSLAQEDFEILRIDLVSFKMGVIVYTLQDQTRSTKD
jgi:hypothetical protein